MRIAVTFTIITLLAIVLFMACLFTGAVDIPATECINALLNPADANPIIKTIVCESRLPMALTAAMCGMLLSLAGIVLQTTFHNPLAGPSILGVSTGASVGVALVMLGAGSFIPAFLSATAWSQAVILIGALLGALVVIVILVGLSSAVRNASMLLIGGIMIGYLASALISWLNFFAPSHEVKNYAIWGMGSFMGVTMRQIPLFSILSMLFCLIAPLLAKPLDALLSGDEYASSLGYSPRRIRTIMLLYSGALTALCTAYCGPVAFLGLATPHIARMAFASSRHAILLPASAITGICTGLLCAWLCVLPSQTGVLPLAAVTPVIGIPVILYVIVRRKKLYYFN